MQVVFGPKQRPQGKRRRREVNNGVVSSSDASWQEIVDETLMEKAASHVKSTAQNA